MSDKTADQHWIDWESDAFGFGYGTGEPHTIPAVRRFLEICPETGSYDFEVFEAEFGALSAWLLINRFCKLDLIEYGTSPRFGWLTSKGVRLREYVLSRTAERLMELAWSVTEDDTICYPDSCNCGPRGFQGGVKCPNPFWLELVEKK